MCRSRRVAAAVVFHPAFSGNNKVRVPGTRARVPSERVRTACCRACESRVCRDTGDVNVCNHKLESFVMATALSASYPGNALLCHCAVQRRRRWRRGRESAEIHPWSSVRPSFPPPSEKLDETAELIPLLLRPLYSQPHDCHSGTK